MNHGIAKMSLVMIFVIALALGFTACGLRFGKTSDPKLHHQYFWFIDQTISVDPSEQSQGRKAAEEQVKCLRCGDALSVFGLHNQTSNAAPICDVELPEVSDDPTHDEEEKCRRKLNQAHQALKEKFSAAFDPQDRASITDIFSAIDRIKPDKTRRTTVFFISDMLQSDHELDLEKVRLTEENIVELLKPIVARHGWQGEQLKGVRIHCILNSLNIQDAAPLNDRRILKKFWGALFQKLEAELVTFDTHLSINQLIGQ